MDDRLLDSICIALNTLGMHPQKLRGQNFLISEDVVRDIASVDVGSGKLPRLEIGAGLASLSSVLAEKEGRLDFIEIEEKFAARLKDLLAERTDTHVHNADALTFDYSGLYGDEPYIIYGNIPYNITSPLLKRLLTAGGNWQYMVLMIQKEAAMRLCRGKGRENGPLTLMLEYFGGGEICFDVPKNAFYPAPAVDSAVIRVKRKEGVVPDEAFFELFSFIDAAFSLRRKTMANSLAAAYPRFPKSYWQELFAAESLSATVRAEACSLRQFSALFCRHTSRLSHQEALPR